MNGHTLQYHFRNKLTLVLLAVTIVLCGCRYSVIPATDYCPCSQVSDTSEEKLFDYQETILENGLRVITLEDFSSPIATVQLWYHVGSKNERPDRQGFAHMFEHMMFRGTDHLGPSDHFKYIHLTGGQNNAYTGFDKTVYLQTLPVNQLDLALWLEAERMAFLKVDRESFETERKVVEEERRVKMNQPYGTTFEKILADVYKVHPYRWMPIGKISHLEAATAEELRCFWQKYYVPNNATLLIVGAVRHQDAQKLAEKYFGWIPRRPNPPMVNISEPLPNRTTTIISGENAPVPLVEIIYRTVPMYDKDSVALDLLAEILGGGNSSRLYRELVAEKQLAADAEAESWSLEQDGMFIVDATLAPSGAEPNAVLQIMQDQIAKLRNEPVSERELLKARNRTLKRVVSGMLTDEDKAEMLGSAAVEQADTSAVNRLICEIKAVTAEGLQRVAKTYLADNRAMIFTVKQNLQAAPVTEESEQKPTAVTESEKSCQRPPLERPESFPQNPPLAPPEKLQLKLDHTSETLENGLKIIVVENNEVPFVSIQLGFSAGAWTEAKAGSASMAMAMLTKGTSDHNEEQLADELDTYAISLAGRAEMDTCTINAGCLRENTEKAMQILGEVVLKPSFPREEFEKLRKQVLTSLAVSAAKPDYIADLRLKKVLYGSHPYARNITGEVNDVEALGVDDAKQWWNRFARPDMAVLIFAGDISRRQALTLAKETFGNWKAAGEQPKPAIAALPTLGETHIYLVDIPGSMQSQIRVAQRGITRQDADYPVSRIVSQYFGFSFDSRLNNTIRINKGLTYSVSGGYIANRFAGEFNIDTYSKTETAAEAVRAILDEINRLKAEGPSAKELDYNKSFMMGVFILNSETPQQVAEYLWLMESQGLGADYFDRLLGGIDKASADDCLQLAKKTVNPEKLAIVVVGDAEKLKDELEKIAPVTVISSSRKF